MNPDQLDLARRLAAHPRFEWRSGMRAMYDPAPFCYGTDRIDEDGWRPDHCDYIGRPDGWPDAKREAWPDLTDAATGGVLLDVLRPGYLEYFPEEHIWLTRKKPAPDAPYHVGKALAEACARALLAEWGEG